MVGITHLLVFYHGNSGELPEGTRSGVGLARESPCLLRGGDSRLGQAKAGQARKKLERRLWPG